MSHILWDKLSDRFNIHKDVGEIHPDAAVNIFVGWPVFFFYTKLFSKYLGKESLDILDFGCGSGALCQELYNKGHCVTGYDHSGEMLKLAKKHTDKNIKYIHSLEKGIQHESLKNNFDLAISMHSLEWIENIEEMIQHIADVIKKEGVFMFAVFPKQHIVESIEKKDLFENFDSAINPTKGVANFDGIEVPVFIREPKDFDDIFRKLNFEKVLEYIPQYPKDFFETYNWPGARYPEMVILAYKKL